MAEEHTGQERTEQPTQRRREEARKKGQVARSRELNTLLTLLFASTAILMLGEWLVQDFLALSRDALGFSPQLVFNSDRIAVHFMHVLFSSLVILTPFFAVVMVAALAGPLLMGGWVFSTQALALNFEKIDPVKGLGRLFSAKGLLELVKALIKFFLLLAVTMLLFEFYQTRILTLSAFNPAEASLRAVNLLAWALFALSGALLFIVFFDVPFELWNHTRQLRMTRQEVRDEQKETDGRPEIKTRIRTLQREIAQRRMMHDVPTADVVITNPTHYAVALRYREAPGSAPTVVARGMDLIALQIQAVARAHEVPLFEAPPLARALYASTDIGEEIPEALYVAVARILAYLYQLRRADATEYVPPPDNIEVPPQYEQPAEPRHGD